ncbi:hypothetical protein L3Q82_016470 [Scortum barcoo]|uniref:Uncharacterized protein n=1 Tax=Scortum barcoo TaxID=214431 RepID=A0ACB8XA42_9TELE|nr:hypothetical protein L3Q82_016470 [Scortum barcoo]
MEVGDSASGVCKLGWWSLFLKRGTGECVPTTQGDHTSQPPREGLRQGTGEENSADSRPSGFRRNNAVFVLVVEHWTSSIPSTGCLRVYGSLPNQSTCALWIWRRHSTVSLVVFCGGAPRVWGPGAFAKGCSVSVRPEQELGSHCRQPGPSACTGAVCSLFECEAAGMRISTSKSEAMVLDRKRVACPLRVGGEVLPQVEEFKYLGILFTSEGKMEREIDRRIGAASAAVMRSVYRTVVVKKELSRKAKLSIYRSIYVPTLTYGHELWVMTERTRSHEYKRPK